MLTYVPAGAKYRLTCRVDRSYFAVLYTSVAPLGFELFVFSDTDVSPKSMSLVGVLLGCRKGSCLRFFIGTSIHSKLHRKLRRFLSECYGRVTERFPFPGLFFF